MGIGKRIKEARLALNLTQEELAKLLGVTKGAVANYEIETSHPKEPIMYKLLDVLKVDANYLFQDVVTVKYEFKADYKEQELIKKYRLISEKDTDGKALVDSTVNYLCNHIHMTQEEDSRLLELKNEKPAKITRLLRYYYGGVSAGSGVYMLNSTESKEIEIPVTPETSKADFVVPVSGNSMEPLFHDGDKILISQSDGTLEIGEIGIFVKNGDAFIKKLGQNELVSLNKEFDNIPLNDFDNVVCLGKVIGRLE